MATHKPELRVVGEAEKPRPRKSESPMQLFERAMRGASNDEALELAYRVLENLTDRCETAADIGIDSDDRDVENEALVFATEVADMTLHLSPGRLRDCWFKAHDAESDLEKAMRNRRARLDGKWSRVEEFSHRRKARVRAAWEVEAARERRQRDDLLERANVTPDRVLSAMRKALEGASEVKAKDVTVALMPELHDPSVAGRQTVVNRVSQVMRRLVAEGAFAQHRPDENDDHRRTCTYTLVVGALAEETQAGL